MKHCCNRIRIAKAFLSIDIAFALLIMSSTFLMLFVIQNDISKQINSQDITKFEQANQDLLHNLIQQKSQIITLKTLNKTYRFQQIEGKNDAILLYILQP